MENYKLNSTLQIRLNKETKAKMKYIAEVQGFKNLSSYIKFLVNNDIEKLGDNLKL